MMNRGDIIQDTYEILGDIDEGGAGIIYLAYHRRLQKKVVLKKIKDNYVGRINERGEADLLKMLHHKYLPQVYDFLQMDRQIFTVIDFVEGQNLSFYLDPKQRFSERQILFWMRQLCEVLEYLHGQNPPIVHSDIKPDNIMITPQGDVCLIDFNISFGNDTSKGISGYSQRYASPEQLAKSYYYKNGGNYQAIVVDGRSDIYSLGITLYHMLTGEKPPVDYRQIRPLRDWGLGYSENLIRIVETAMQPLVQDRYQTIEDMQSDVLSIKKRDKEYRHAVTLQWILIALGCLLLAGGAGTAYWGFETMRVEEFDSEYDDLVDAAKTDDYETIVSDGIDLLNEGRFQKAMDKEQEKKADILYMIANSYFEQDDYEHAISFYEDAVQFNQTNAEYYRDYAIALARTEDIDNAEKTLDEAITCGLGEDHIHLVQAEISLGKGESEAAIDEFEQAISLTEDPYLKNRAYLLCARAYRQTGDTKGEIGTLEEAATQVDARYTNAVQRALGAAYMRVYNQTSDKSEKEQYAVNAIQCYEILTQGDNPGFNDRMNLAVLYEIQEDYANCESVLLEMLELYPDDYRVYMRLALLGITVEGKKAEDNRDYSQVESDYNQAEQYYEKERNSGASDETMQSLEDAMDQLYSKGWLSE